MTDARALRDSPAEPGRGSGEQPERLPWGEVPPVPDGADLRARIRALRVQAGRMIGVLDDDPTGSQSVHGVQVVTVPDPAESERALAGPAPTAFVLTNTRSLAEPDAVALAESVAGDLLALAARAGRPIDLVSRSDSTLRGHVLAEIGALDRARRAAVGRGHDAVLFVPTYLEAGRVTAGDVHWARIGERFVPVSETEFARDATFGYGTSNLREFLVAAGRGAVAEHRVHSIGLTDIRRGGPDRVAELLDGVGPGDLVVVNALDYADLETVALAALNVEATGKSLLYRTGPSFVRALDGQEPKPALTGAQIWPGGHPGGHGLIVVGSHVGQTSRQVEALRSRCDVIPVELDVPELLASGDPAAYVARAAARVTEGLSRSDVLLLTSRTLVGGAIGDAGLSIARRVSAAVADVVRRALAAGPSWVLAKGGITSHDVAVSGLGIRRAEVAGQLFEGMVSLYRPVSARERAVGRPYVVFAGNVGDERALADVVARMSAEAGG
ncbi:four-carbon acid sugar kinase family protein [Rugosimonospora acidiphila]|uniref:Four-carbon acid sugar kinase family protein n=1 Tax=Rugosimonospora acidiphila TaxID=556531 RepID=A0ABP9RV67_9ACTN